VSAFVAVLCASASAESWRQISTRHFDLLTTNGVERGKSSIAHLESVRPFLERTLGAGSASGAVQIVAFSSHREYQPYQWTDFALGYAVPRQPHGLIVLQSLEGEMSRVLVHEYVHLLLRRTGATYPTWLEEGLAEFYSTVRVEGEAATLGEFAAGNDQRLRSSRLLPMESLATPGQGLPLFGLGGLRVFYSQCWALVHMLHFDGDYSGGWAKLLRAIGGGVTARDAFRTVYGKQLEQVEADLEAYIREGRHSLRWSRPAPLSELIAPRVATPDRSGVEGVLAEARSFAKRSNRRQ
jgi:hypothetical protein